MLTDDSIMIESLLSAMDNPYNFQPKPSQINLLSQADLFITSGIGLEESFLGDIEKVLLELEIIDSAKEITYRQLESHDHDDELNRDPHFWMSPESMLKTLPVIEAALLKTCPEKSYLYITLTLDILLTAIICVRKLLRQGVKSQPPAKWRNSLKKPWRKE